MTINVVLQHSRPCACSPPAAAIGDQLSLLEYWQWRRSSQAWCVSTSYPSRSLGCLTYQYGHQVMFAYSKHTVVSSFGIGNICNTSYEVPFPTISKYVCTPSACHGGV